MTCASAILKKTTYGRSAETAQKRGTCYVLHAYAALNERLTGMATIAGRAVE